MRKMPILFTGLFVLLFLSLAQAVSDQKEEKAKAASSEQEAAVEQKAVAEEETSVEQESPLKAFRHVPLLEMILAPRQLGMDTS